MKSPLIISAEEIKKLISKYYPFIVENLEFLPEGEDGAIYKFNSGSEEYIIKFIGIRGGRNDNLSNERWQRIVSFSMDNEFDFISLPEKSQKNKVVLSEDGYNFAVFRFIKGKSWLSSNLNNKNYENLGEVISRLHNSNAKKYGFEIDQFNLDNISKLARDLDLIEQRGNRFEYEEKLYQLLIPWVKILRQGIERISQVRTEMLKNQRKLVLTHGDLNPSNVFFTNGEIQLIDCEDMMLSFPERDIVFFNDDDVLPFFLSEYRKFFSESLNVTAFEFFKYKWDLESVGAWINTILREKYSNEQLEHEFEFLQKDLEAHGELKSGLDSFANILSN